VKTNRKRGGNNFCLIERLEPRQLLSASPKVFVTQTNLVSNQASVAPVQDTNLINAWGVSFAPGGQFWISANNSGVSEQFNGDGSAGSPPTVTIPGAGGASPSNPTGQVYAGGSMSFNGTPEIFVFVGEDGGITGWSGAGTTATMIHDNSASGAVYKGATLAQDAGGNTDLFAANFRSGKIEEYDNTFTPVALSAGAFSDKKIPKGYAPFNVQNVGGDLYVTYAKQNSLKHDDVKGAGHGFVDVFDTSGHLVRRLAHGAYLNSPWGVAVAPTTWGAIAGDVLVGQFGSGNIDVFNTKGKFVQMLSTARKKPIVIDRLWALTPGSGAATLSTNSIFFTAGPNDENNGLFGKLDISSAAASSGPGTSPYTIPTVGSPMPMPSY
jgi:uncharacterized protein (TIGR03118 family)